jgi:type VI secretion system secreted protein Hcp
MDNEFADIFVKFDKTIKGESNDHAHKGELEVTSFSIGANQASSFAVGQGGGVGKCVFHNLVFTAKTSLATPKLILGCATGEHYDVTMTVRKAGTKQHDYLIMEFKRCMVTSIQVAGDGNAVLPTDTVTLSYQEFKVSYKPQDTTGSMGGVVAAGYSLDRNCPL